MRFRPDFTTSERQLVQAMADRGRPVPLARLASWRHDGLLPPLASHGLGAGKGKSYYWREPDILEHACAVFDFLAHYGRPDAVLWMLWLQGYPVPLPQLRRAWASRGRTRNSATVRPAANAPAPLEKPGTPMIFDGAADVTSFLLKMTLTLWSAVAPGDDDESRRILDVLRRALSRTARVNRVEPAAQSAMASQLWHAISFMAATPEAGALIAEASEADLRDGQRYLGTAAALLRTCERESPAFANARPGLWSSWLAERIGPPLFLLILVLLRADQRPLLDDIARDIEHASRPETSPPARVYATAARASVSRSGTRMPQSA